MGVTNWLVLFLTHPNEFRTLLQFYLYHEQKRDIQATQEHPTSGWDRASMRRCWEFLDQTSRSFAAVIKELDGDLARTICLFYLVLRGLDTIEDDMTIPDEVKQPILRSFHKHTVTPGWTFDGCGPKEKDRQVLVEYNIIVDELNLLLPEYREVIIDITHKMANGMADYAHKAATTGSIYLSTISEYDLYCHYVAGLVGEGLSRIFSASKKEAPWLGSQLELSNSMGLLLQKTNIIRDFREDTDQHRHFWPKEIWGRKEFGFEEMNEMYRDGAEERALWVSTAMIVDALRHATDALDYLRLLKNQSVFNFCAIPAAMAIATLELCFMNPKMFQMNIKIRKAEAAKLIMRSTNPREVAVIFREYTRKIHRKAVISDPNFLELSVTCGKIEQWCEHHFPSFVQLVERKAGSHPAAPTSNELSLNPYDLRSKIVQRHQLLDAAEEKKQMAERFNARVAARGGVVGAGAGGGAVGEGAGLLGTSADFWEFVTWIGGALFLILGLSGGIIWAVLKFSEEFE
ncbi:squalene synthase [Pluteus cervinus]|uniref:Squalene synthase n=1 Tax=Pluteus cervinus TaxID=181527 RepID=A0ACD3A9T9_9AGAR|nr:squalene synthase [Pluteus cervinus]